MRLPSFRSPFVAGLLAVLCCVVTAGCTVAVTGTAPPEPTSVPLTSTTLPPTTSPPTAGPATPLLPEDALWAELRTAPGLVVMLRHTNTEPGQGDPPGFVLDDCPTQRNLDEQGREEARLLGTRFRDRGVAVAAVASSRYCRCLETADLLGLGQVTPRPELDSLFDDAADTERRSALVRDLVAGHAGQPGTLVLVSHQRNIAAISGVSPGTGEGVVLRANGGLEVVGILPGV